MEDFELMIQEVKAGTFQPNLYSLSKLIALEAYVREQYDRAKVVASSWTEIYDKLSLQVVPERMQEEGVTNMKIENVGRVELRADMWVTTRNTDALQQWLIERDMGDIIKPTVNGSTLKAFLREQMKKGQDIPDEEIVSIVPYIRAVIVGRSS
jgi:hypothetical protein